MAQPERLDALIIGTGQGGKPLAGTLAEAGWRSAIVERGRVGGTCVVEGCTPTKTMVASARIAHLARRAEDYGVTTGPVSVDLEAVRRRKRDIVDEWSASSRRGMERHEALELILGEARFTGEREVMIAGSDGERRVRADHVFINAGARPRIPQIPGLSKVPFLDSTSIMELGAAPEHLLVLGGGFIGLEFGQMFRRFGSRVTVLESGPRIAGREDPDISEAMADIFAEDGIDVRTSCEVVRVEGAAGEVVLVVEGEGGEERVRGSHLLVAVGRVPNTDALDPGAAGIEMDARGFIPVDDRCRTSVEGVWGLGDITGAPPFTHIAYDDFRVIRSQLFGDGRVTREDRLLPYTLFTDPQLGRVGLTEKESRERGHEVRVGRLPMSRVARAIEIDETRGFMKVVVDATTDRILGAAILGVEGGEVVAVLQMAMLGGLRFQIVRDAVLAHPTLAESLNKLFKALE